MIVHKPSRSLLLKVKSPKRIQEVISKSRAIDHEGHNLAIRHGLDETRVLRNLGIQAPSPIRYYYPWGGQFTPMSHQIETADFLTMNRRCFVLNEMGTSKTRSTIWAFDYLMRIGVVRKVLVVAPLSTMATTWQREIFDAAMHRTTVVLHGSKAKRLERLAMDVDVYIVNHDGISVVGSELRSRKDIDLIIWDECSELRNSATDRYENFRNMLRAEQRLWMLSGAPCPNAPTDAWAQCRLVDPTRVPRYFNAFRRLTMLQVSQFKWVPRQGSNEIVWNAMQPAIRFKKADCIDLPPMIQVDRECPLTAEQTRVYKEMVTYMVSTGKGKTISAVNAADHIGKLRQILIGAVKIPEGDEYMEIDHTPRINLLLECIAEANAKAIVIVPFKGILESLKRSVSKHYTCEVVNGDVTLRRRNKIFAAFKDTPDPHVLLCHPRVMSHGLTLTEADMLIFYAPIYSADQYHQVKERINRPGQKRKMTLVRIGANKLEWDIYKAMDSKGEMQEMILDLYKNEVGCEVTFA